ncbi:unnamed protein product [Strongylus vulgaris]|uniref:Carboxylesterase type B domain-containing protein n=1 Tax=Strongylus vulgaris TaxID=40348 RepID=A0A3P7J4C0_STRVU|nr:unnamed protein product [Strongylus vulgaris]
MRLLLSAISLYGKGVLFEGWDVGVERILKPNPLQARYWTNLCDQVVFHYSIKGDGMANFSDFENCISEWHIVKRIVSPNAGFQIITNTSAHFITALAGLVALFFINSGIALRPGQPSAVATFRFGMQLFALLSLLIAQSYGQVLEKSRSVWVEQGLVRGKIYNIDGRHIQIFRGIPYAEPPLGNLRFHVSLFLFTSVDI